MYPHLIPHLFQDAILNITNETSPYFLFLALITLEIIFIFQVGYIAIFMDDFAAFFAHYLLEDIIVVVGMPTHFTPLLS